MLDAGALDETDQSWAFGRGILKSHLIYVT